MWGGDAVAGGGPQKCRRPRMAPSPNIEIYVGVFQRVFGGGPNLPIKCSSICVARFMLGRSNLATRTILDARGRSPHVLVK
jgi:hypothetical protein